MAAMAVAVYAVLVLGYFMPGTMLPYKIVWPVAILAAATISTRNVWAVLAFAFSALGDFGGAIHNFLLQMGFFALGHVCFIVYFSQRLTKIKRPSRAMIYLLPILGAFLLILAKFIILMNVPEGVLKVGTAIYAFLIVVMAELASMQRNLLSALGGILFVASDFILAYNKFTAPVDHSGIWIMTTYYAAQLLLFLAIQQFSGQRRNQVKV